MGLNDTPSGERIHIGFFGARNAGKSSLVNAVTGQEISVVSDTKGTTTDPVTKAMELLPLGPVVIIDTPGYDDEGELGELRVKRTKRVLNKVDIAVLVVNAEVGMTDCDRELSEMFRQKGIKSITVFNKSDVMKENVRKSAPDGAVFASAKSGDGIQALKGRLAELAPDDSNTPCIVKDLLKPGDTVILVTPIDSAAPKGRLILPQQMTIREVLDAGAMAYVTKESTLTETLLSLKEKPAMVITDSQVFGQVSKLVPPEIPLTSFSILMARHKGLLTEAVHGVQAIDRLCDGDVVLISEGCTHHRQCGDIGSVKLPALLRKYTGKDIKIELSSGQSFPEDLSKYALILHCGGCMLNARELLYRMKCAADAGVFMSNYGISMSYMQGILLRTIKMIPEAIEVFENKRESR